MKSKIIKAASLEALLESDNWQPQIVETDVQRQIRQYCLSFKRYKSCGRIASGDIATVKLQAEDSFFNRDVKINVGKGLFDKELESLLIGMRREQTAELFHSKVGMVRVTVQDIQRLVIPELTDELVCKSGDGICTVQDFLKKLHRELAAEQVREKAFEYIDALIAQSEVLVEREEVESLVSQEMEKCRGIAASMGRVFDEMTEEELLGAVGRPDIESFKSMVRDMMRVNICQALLLKYWQKEDAAKLPIVENDVLDASCGAFDYVLQKLFVKLQLV